ncbi:ankyrin repeat-containing domain protein [Colletotrichum lupini]|nr:ankyrin repeat-containing domain protein [Colletotrichum lupini]
MPSPSTSNASERSSSPQSHEGGARLHIDGCGNLPLRLSELALDNAVKAKRFLWDDKYVDNHGNTALLHATQGHSKSMLLKITHHLKHGDEFNVVCSQRCCTPLINLVRSGDDDPHSLNKLWEKGDMKPMIKELIKAGAQVNLDNSLYGTALNKACFDGNLAMVQFLHKEYGADANFVSQGFMGNALQAACFGKERVLQSETDKILEYLVLKAGAKVDQNCGFFGTALNLACLLPLNSTWTVLSKKLKANLTIADQMGRLPIHFAAVHSYDRYLGLSQLLSKKGDGYLNLTDKTGRTALHWAAQSGEVQTVKTILSSGRVDVNQADKDGWTALCWAARGLTSKVKFAQKDSQHQVEVIEHLLNSGANGRVKCVREDKVKWYPVEIAYFHNSGKDVIAALSKASDPKELQKLKDERGRAGYEHHQMICSCCQSIHPQQEFGEGFPDLPWSS